MLKKTMLISVQVGKPQRVGDEDPASPMSQAFTSGIVKKPVTERVWCSFTNLSGDGQHDLKHHGGRDKAVLLYSTKNYEDWVREESWTDLVYGGFGENLTISDWNETTVCIGDVFQIGETVLEVSQPRYPCWKLARRWGRESLVNQVIQNGRTGWYARVLQEGYVGPGDDVVLTERPYPEFTVEFASQVLNERETRQADATRLRTCKALSLSWQV